MKIQKFEDIIVWQKAQIFILVIYHEFNLIKDYGFKNQICRATISISNNIAEGFDRQSNADFKRFLYFALGSCSEVKSMLYLAGKLKYTDIKITNKLILNCSELSRIIQGLIKSLK